MMISTIIFIIAMSVDFIMDFEVGHQVCPHCNHVFKPSLLKVLFARKKGTPVNLQRKMKCPKCKETSWTNRILD